MKDSHEEPAGQKKNGRTNVAVPDGLHGQFSEIVELLPAQFPTLREAAVIALTDFVKKHRPAALKAARLKAKSLAV